MSVRILVESVVNPTEDEKKVERALRNLFPAGKIEGASPDGGGRLRIQGEGLEFLSTLRDLIRQERIRGAARAILMRRAYGQRLDVYLNKQAAFVGRISFCEPEGESPHGPISIAIEAANPDDVVEYLTYGLELRRR